MSCAPQAIEGESFLEAARIKKEIDLLVRDLQRVEAMEDSPDITAALEQLEIKKKSLIEDENYLEAEKVKMQIHDLQKKLPAAAKPDAASDAQPDSGSQIDTSIWGTSCVFDLDYQRWPP